MIQMFFRKLKESIEDHSIPLKRGKLFLPEYLKGKRFSNSFSPIIKSVTKELRLKFKTEVRNYMPNPKEYDCGNWQQVDFVLHDKDRPIFFVELESIDRSQLYLFRDHPQMNNSDIDNKLWYYYGTLAKKYCPHQLQAEAPRYFVSLLILPDQKVSHYKIWDTDHIYNLFHPSLEDLVYENPYRFYDHIIKTSARHFLENKQEFEDPKTGKAVHNNLIRFQKECELVLITCTGQHLILSRGIHLFDPKKEKQVKIQWR